MTSSSGTGTQVSKALLDIFKGKTPEAPLINYSPRDIFKTVLNSRLFLTILLPIFSGLVTAVLLKEWTEEILSYLEQSLSVFIKIMSGILFLAPFFIFCIIASYVARLETGDIVSLGSFLVLTVVELCLITFIAMVVTASVSKRNIFGTLKSFEKPLVVALSTSNSFAAMPLSIEALKTELNFSEKLLRQLLPLETIINQWGNALFFSALTTYLVEILKIHIGWGHELGIVLASVFMSIAAPGIPALGLYTIMFIVLVPLGIPIKPASAIFITAMSAVDPFVTVANVAGVIGSVTMVLSGKKEKG